MVIVIMILMLRMASVAATQERDLGARLPQGAVNPWVLPDMPYQQR